MFAAPLLGPILVPRQPIRVQANGIRATTKPTNPLKAWSTTLSDMVDDAQGLQGCWIAERATKVSLDSSLRIEVQLLEHFGRDGQQSGTPDSLEDRLMGFFATQTIVVLFELGHIGY